MSREAWSAAPDAAPANALTDFLREETTTGKVLLAPTAVALAWANLAPDGGPMRPGTAVAIPRCSPRPCWPP